MHLLKLVLPIAISETMLHAAAERHARSRPVPACRTSQSRMLTIYAQVQPLEGVPVRERCEAASVGEYWFREHVVHTLKECGPACSNIQ